MAELPEASNRPSVAAKPVSHTERLWKAEVRIAQTTAERDRIYAFRYPIYVGELGRQVSFADHERRWVKDKLDDDATHLYVEREGVVVAAMRGHIGVPYLFPRYLREAYRLDAFARWPETSLSFSSRLMVRRDSRIAGIDHDLAVAWWQLAVEKGFLFNFMHSAERLAVVFERMGCIRFGEVFEEPEIGPRQPFVLPRWGREVFAALGSPLAEVALPEPDPHGAVSWFQRTF